MRILITGICGFVGSTLARAWVDRGSSETLMGLDSLSRGGSETNRQVLRDLGIRVVHGDIRIPSDVDSLPAVDWVVDASANPSVLAGVDGLTSSRQLVEHNLLGTVNILEYCRRHRAGLILLSTSRVYSIAELSRIRVRAVNDAFEPWPNQSVAGFSSAGVSEAFSTDPPLSLYGTTKRASEQLALEYGTAFDFPVWINRCGVLAGAGQFGRADQGIFSFWIHAWARRRPLGYIGFDGTGWQVRDCLHPRDLVSLLEKQMQSRPGSASAIVNVSGGAASACSLHHLSDWCADRFGPHEISSSGVSRTFDIPWLVLDSAAAMQQWAWQPTTRRDDILEEIAVHAESHPDWLEMADA